jgi:Rod binding domain-containing protein
MTSDLTYANLGTSHLGLMRKQGVADQTAQTLLNAAETKDRRVIREKAEEFESQFLSQMMGHMFKDIATSGVFGGGHAEEVWRDFYVDEMAKSFANRGGIGLADTIERQLLMLQEAA